MSKKSLYPGLSEAEELEFLELERERSLNRKTTMAEDVKDISQDVGKVVEKEGKSFFGKVGEGAEEFGKQYGLIERSPEELAKRKRIEEGFAQTGERFLTPKEKWSETGTAVVAGGLGVADAISYNTIRKHFPEAKKLIEGQPGSAQMMAGLAGLLLQGSAIYGGVKYIPKIFAMRSARKLRKATRLLKKKLGRDPTNFEKTKMVDELVDKSHKLGKRLVIPAEAAEGAGGETLRRHMRGEEYPWKGEGEFISDDVLFQGAVPPMFHLVTKLLRAGKRAAVKTVTQWEEPTLKSFERLQKDPQSFDNVVHLSTIAKEKQGEEVVKVTKQAFKKHMARYDSKMWTLQKRVHDTIKKENPGYTFPIAKQLREKLDDFKGDMSDINLSLKEEQKELLDIMMSKQKEIAYLQKPARAAKAGNPEKIKVLSDEIADTQKKLNSMPEDISEWKPDLAGFAKDKYEKTAKVFDIQLGKSNKPITIDQMFELKKRLNVIGDVLESEAGRSSETVQKAYHKLNHWFKEQLYSKFPEAEYLNLMQTRQATHLKKLKAKLDDPHKSLSWLESMSSGKDPALDRLREISDPQAMLKSRKVYDTMKGKGHDMSAFQESLTSNPLWEGTAGNFTESYGLLKQMRASLLEARGATGGARIMQYGGGAALAGAGVGYGTGGKEDTLSGAIMGAAALVGGVALARIVGNLVRNPKVLAKIANPEFASRTQSFIKRIGSFPLPSAQRALTKWFSQPVPDVTPYPERKEEAALLREQP